MDSEMIDIFMPKLEPARSIYIAFHEESKKRDNRDYYEWLIAEREAVFKASIIAAEKYGYRKPSMEEIESAERSALGHVDYGAKWVYGIVDYMRK